MKYAILVPDGMSDYPLEALEQKTPLEVAKTPNMDLIANQGIIGRVKTIPEGLTPGSDVANLAILGYDPKKNFPGRGPLEAANLGIKLEENDSVLRCNLVTVFDNKMVDYSSGHIKSLEAEKLIKSLTQNLSNEHIKFYPGVSYRHILVIKNSAKLDFKDLRTTPPHDILGKEISKYLPKGKSADFLTKLMKDSVKLLESHEINTVRLDLKENPANMIWLWGYGQKVNLPSFKEKYGLTGGVISAVDLIKGIGKSIGLESVNVTGATGYYDTNYEGKAEAAIRILKKHDFVYVHVEAPDEAGHNGDLKEKILAIERFDQFIVGPILHYLETQGDFRILVLPDHPTPIALRTHASDPVPFAMKGKNIIHSATKKFCEIEAGASDKIFNSGEELMKNFLKS